MKLVMFWMTLVSLMLVGSVSGQVDAVDDDRGVRPAASDSPVTAGKAPTIVKGVARFTGKKPPKRRKIGLDSDPVCADHHKGKDFRSESVLVNEDGTLRNVFVWVSKGLEGKSFPAPAKPAVLDQIGCRFEPHVQGVRSGQGIVVRNSDATTHNVHTLPKLNESSNFSQSKKGAERTISFKRKEVMVLVKCDIHPWMSAYIGVVDHPFFAVTGDGGSFEFKDLPPGKYTISAWHEKYGTKTQEVTVTEGATPELKFEFKKKRRRRSN